MSGVTMADMSEVAAELRAALDEHDQVCSELAGAETAHKRAYLTAHAASTSFHPERKVKEHEIAAEEASFDAWSTMNMLTYQRKALQERMHSLRQVLSAFQTQARVEADFDRTAA